MPSFNHVVSEDIPNGLRLDRYVAESLGLLSRSQIKARSLKCKVNGKDVKISRLVKSGDSVELFWNDAPPLYLQPENIPLDIIYEDRRSVVVNKPSGMVVHPGAGNRSGTLANALYYRRLAHSGLLPAAAGNVATAAAASANVRPGIVHRLDKETSGVIIAAYDDECLAFLAGQFKARTTRKTYVAIVSGVLAESSGRIETCIARSPRDRKQFAVSTQGRHALTFYKVVKTWRAHSLVLLRPKTGRTHQLRVHLRHLGHPIAGDSVYGFPEPLFAKTGLMLHAKSLAIVLPEETSPRTFKAPLPERFAAVMQKLNNIERGGNGR